MLKFWCTPIASSTVWLRLWQISMQEFSCDFRSLFYLESKHTASCTVVIFSALGECVLMHTCEVLNWNYEVVKPGAAGEGCELPMGRWVCHGPMCGDDGKENAVFVILVLPHVGPCSSQPLAPGPPASTARVCSCCPGRKATATPSPSMAFWTASPTYIFWSELSCHHYTPTMCGEHWGIVSACTEAAALHGRGRRLCRSCSGLTACSSHSLVSVCRGVVASSSPPASHTASAPCSGSQLPLSWNVTLSGIFTIFTCIKMTLLWTALLLLFLGPQMPSHHSWESPNVFRPLLSGKQLCV